LTAAADIQAAHPSVVPVIGSISMWLSGSAPAGLDQARHGCRVGGRVRGRTAADVPLPA